MTKTSNHREAANVTTSVHEAGAVLFHSATGRVFALNTSAARIWQAIEGRVALRDIATELSQEYGIPFTTAWEHVTSFLLELEGQSLIEESPEQ